MSRAAIVSALEALEVGDQAYAVEILLSALEDGPTAQRRQHECHCGRSFNWPGERDEHRRVAHLEEAA